MNINLLNQTEHIADIFTKIVLKTMTDGIAESSSDEITLAQYQALKHVAQHGACTIGSLAGGLSVSQPAATMLIDRMAKRGLVDRKPSESDRRQAEISLTSHSQVLLDRIEGERTHRLSRILEQMESGDRDRFVESIERFIEAAVKIEPFAGESCLKCGKAHLDDCIVNQTHIALSSDKTGR